MALDLVFEHRIQSLHYEMTPEEVKSKVVELFGKIEEAYEDPDIYKPSRETEGPLKHDDSPQEEFKRLPVNPDKLDVPETDEQKLPGALRRGADSPSVMLVSKPGLLNRNSLIY